MNPGIFREYDIRGVAGKDLSPEFAHKLGLAYCAFAKKKLGKQKLTISVGRDCRNSGEAYSSALIKGLMAAGAEVISLGLVTTPMTYFTIHQWSLDGAIMVTGSHNPPQYNGFKMCVGKATLFGKDIQSLREIMEQDDKVDSTSNGTQRKEDIFPHYLNYLVGNIKLSRPLKVVVDAGNGAASDFAPQIYRKLGCEIIELFCEADGNFPNHEADPTVEKNLQDLIRSVKENKADIGIGFDGDADRVGVVDENGTIIWGDELMVIFSRELLKKHPGATIISEVKSSHRLYNDIKLHGGNGIMWKTGHSLIKAKMKETGALLAGEMSGHIFFADRFFGFDDGVYAGARLLEILSNSKKPASALLENLPKSVNTPEIRVECDDESKWEIVEKIKHAMSKRFQTNEIDGVRVEFGDGWGLVRASNTQPVIVMRFEAQSQTRLNEIREIIEAEARKNGLKV
jgi:phosphomannomutase/phosphoglucomutase